MKLSLCLLCLWFSLSACSLASEPFADLEAAASNSWGGWHGSQAELSKHFASERKRLGGKFESSLLHFIAGDPDRHYRVSLYLSKDTYLHGQPPLPFLAIAISEQGIVLARNGQGARADHRLVCSLVSGAVLCARYGFLELAIAHRTEAAELIYQSPPLEYAWPALSPEDKQLLAQVERAVAGRSQIESGREAPISPEEHALGHALGVKSRESLNE